MPKQNINSPLKKSSVQLLKNFFQLMAIDALINARKVLWTLLFSGLALIFSLATWVYFMVALMEYLLSHGLSHEIIFLIIFLLNAIGLTACIFLAYRQLKSIRFAYTECSIKKIMDAVGAPNENA
jgi:hypothetical protein